MKINLLIFIVAIAVCFGKCASGDVSPITSTDGSVKSKVVKNIPYKNGTGLTAYERERCYLDLYMPISKNNFSTIVWFHGGGLESGSKDEAVTVAIAKCFASNGVAVALVNYRLSPKAVYPAYIDDAAASVAWIVNHIQEYGGNSKSVFISGHSAGGYLTAIVGMDPKYLAKYGVDTSRIAGIIPVSGQVFTHFTIRKEQGIPNPQNTPTIDDAAPCYHVRKDAPPLLAICGDHDWPARAEENRYFIAMLKTVGDKDAEYQEFANRDHGSIISKIPEAHDPVAEAILNFVKKHE